MKKHIVVAGLCAALLFVVSCSSNTQVTRVDPATQTDLSGYWNDTDVKIVCETLISECLASARVAQFQKTTGKVPVFIVGTFRNDSDEHIDTSIITKKMESAILNSGKAEFVASKNERSEVRDERQEQQAWASEESAKALANELGADFMLIGSVKTIVDRSGDGKTRTRTYYVYGELLDVETGRKVWIGENADIKKILKNSSARF